jgi:opacity protein-like surface antigen
MKDKGNLRGPARAAIAALMLLAFSGGPALAEDLKGKFYIGGNLGVLVTNDNIRNNAALIIAPLGDDGAPFTGDKGEEVSCDSGNIAVYCDPRPDDLIARQTAIETTFQGDIRFGYGLTSSLSLEFSAGYFEGNVNNLDVYTTKLVPISNNPLDPCLDPSNPQAEPCRLTSNKLVDFKTPITAGKITEIPLELNAIVRFRKDSNLNPYLGGGIGYLITSLEQSPEVDAMNKRFASLHLLNTSDEFGPNFGKVFSSSSDGNAAFLNPAEVTIDDGFQWQFTGGVDYFFNDWMSLQFEAKYVIARNLPWDGSSDAHTVKISFKGEDQINLFGYPEDMFRANGSVKVFTKAGGPPNPVDPASPSGMRFDCDIDNDGDIIDDLKKDYDGDGNGPDQCYDPAPGVSGTLRQTTVAQGGSIDLTNFTFGFGLKFHF